MARYLRPALLSQSSTQQDSLLLLQNSQVPHGFLACDLQGAQQPVLGHTEGVLLSRPGRTVSSACHLAVVDSYQGSVRILACARGSQGALSLSLKHKLPFGRYSEGLAFSPDGALLAFINRPSGDTGRPSGRSNLAVFDVQTGALHVSRLDPGATKLRWSSDGCSLALLSYESCHGAPSHQWSIVLVRLAP